MNSDSVVENIVHVGSGCAGLSAAGMGCQAAIEAERWLAEHS